jgi:hypothetical protein
VSRLKILVFSRNRKLPERLRLRRRKGVVDEVDFAGVEEFAQRLKAIDTPTLCYLDVSSLEARKIPQYLRSLRKADKILYGVIDPTGKIKDVAALFHGGAVDYLNRRLLADGVGMGRMTGLLDFVRAVDPALLERAAEMARNGRQAPYIPSGNDWSSVVQGREYTFSMLFIELDGRERMEKSYAAKNLSIALASFRRYVDGFVNKFGGRVWLWSGFGGVVLFPFDGKSCPAMTCGFRLMLFKHLYDIEGSLFPHFLSLRTALHIGNIPYTEEDTGHVVADGLNFIFHLGQQFVQPGNFCITEEAMQMGHSALRGYFVDSGTFEGRKILRMRLPVHQYKKR